LNKKKGERRKEKGTRGKVPGERYFEKQNIPQKE